MVSLLRKQTDRNVHTLLLGQSPRQHLKKLGRSSMATWAAALVLSVGAAGGSGIILSATAQTEGYRITHGDKVSVTVFGQPELTGEFVVDQSGSVRMPIIGDVGAEDRTAGELESQIVRGLSQGFVKSPVVSVRVAEFSPINVVGLVRQPGLFPYRQGMTVLSAIVQAGGIGLAGGGRPDAAMGEILQSDERVRLLEISRVRLLAKRARLTAQIDERDEVDFSGMSAAMAAGPSADEIMDSERRQFQLEAESTRARADILEKQISRIKREISSLDVQKTAVEKQRKLNAELLADYEGLMKGGLTRKQPLIEAKREEARLDGQFARLESERTAAEMQASDAEFKLAELRSENRRRSYAELQESEKALMELSVTLPTARRTQAFRAQQGGIPGEDGRQPAILVIRQSRGKSEQHEADLDAKLRPGDIVQIGALFAPPVMAPPAVIGTPSAAIRSPVRITVPEDGSPLSRPNLRADVKTDR